MPEETVPFTRSGPLVGLRVIEFGAIGPAPFAAMILADMGADVLRITRPNENRSDADFCLRGKIFVELNLKSDDDKATALDLIKRADILIEGNRPGVMERLGLGPKIAQTLNPALVYGRMTGWGQTGPLAQAAGHDLNYIAITGMVDAIRAPGGKPAIPLNLIGDLGGGAMFLISGILAALLEVRRSGRGQVVDAAIVDGVNLFSGFFHSMRAQGRWQGQPGENILDGGAPFYDTYECADGKYISIGSIEPQFYALLCDLAGLTPVGGLSQQHDISTWDANKAEFAQVFYRKTRDEWCAILQGTDVCFAPVLTMSEAVSHPHNHARDAFEVQNGLTHPAPAPRFDQTPLTLNAIDTTRITAAQAADRWQIPPSTTWPPAAEMLKEGS